MEWAGRLSSGHGSTIRGRPVALDRLFHEPHANGLGGNSDSADFSVDDRPNALDVGFELAFGDAGRLATNAAEILGLTLAGDGPAGTGLFTSEIADSGHIQTRS